MESKRIARLRALAVYGAFKNATIEKFKINGLWAHAIITLYDAAPADIKTLMETKPMPVVLKVVTQMMNKGMINFKIGD